MAEDIVLANESGFEIHQQNDLLYFVDRKTFGFALAAWIFGGLAFIFGVAGIALTLTVSFWLFFLILASSFLASIAHACYRRYAERNTMPWDQVETIYIADPAKGKFLTKDKKPLCNLAEIEMQIRFDPFDSTRGFMRWILFSWQGGSVRVFKTNSKVKAKTLVEQLGELMSAR